MNAGKKEPNRPPGRRMSSNAAEANPSEAQAGIERQ